jgi:ketosteroid isomerase-like protein
VKPRAVFQTHFARSAGLTAEQTGRCILGWKKITGEWKVVWQIFNTY